MRRDVAKPLGELPAWEVLIRFYDSLLAGRNASSSAWPTILDKTEDLCVQLRSATVTVDERSVLGRSRSCRPIIAFPEWTNAA